MIPSNSAGSHPWAVSGVDLHLPQKKLDWECSAVGLMNPCFCVWGNTHKHKRWYVDYRKVKETNVDHFITLWARVHSLHVGTPSLATSGVASIIIKNELMCPEIIGRTKDSPSSPKKFLKKLERLQQVRCCLACAHPRFDLYHHIWSS